MSEFNKARLKQYEEYKDCFHVKFCLKNGRYIKQNYMGDIDVRTQDKLRIGIDQSSSQTGMAIKKESGELVCLIDFVNTSSLPFGLYKAMLGMKIEQIFNSANVSICVLEKMWGGNRKAYDMLTNLADFLSGFKYILPGWAEAEVSSILPNVWRSAYLKGPEYKGRFTKDKVKLAAVEEGIKRYSVLYEYAYLHKEGSHYNDSFDALGILEGYEEKTFSKDGTIRKVANTIATTNHMFDYKIVLTDNVELAKESASENSYGRDVVEFEYNTEFPFYENMRKATSVTNKAVVMRITDSVAKIQLMWRFLTPLNKNEDVFLIGWREKISTKLGNY